MRVTSREGAHSEAVGRTSVCIGLSVGVGSHGASLEASLCEELAFLTYLARGLIVRCREAVARTRARHRPLGPPRGLARGESLRLSASLGGDAASEATWRREGRMLRHAGTETVGVEANC